VFTDGLGRNILATGIFDPTVTEAIHRLVDHGGLSVDVGANIGYFTGLLASRTGPGGAVIAFEPHPTVFPVLICNTNRWNADPGLAAIEARQIAISDQEGTGRLAARTGPQQMGIATLRKPGEVGVPEDFQVETRRLDTLCQDRRIQLLKIDVEGHEYAVLKGAERLLEQQMIRDIIFEDFETYPTPAMTLLEENGLAVFTLDRSVLGPKMHPVQEGPAPQAWPGRNYLATLDPRRAITRLGANGWQSMHKKSSRWLTANR
jgi:FkbM family methyltransferase